MDVARTDPDLLAVARGDAPADVVLRGGRVVNVIDRTVSAGCVAIFGGRIAAVGDEIDARRVVDLGGAYVAPGLIDAHMHVESTMMPPSQFVRLAIPHGTTGVVFDPHEIANVAGIAGIRYLMDDADGLPMNIMFAASSCVPASPLETAGAELSASDLAPLFDDERVVALAEMMNFPGVVNADPGVLAKVRLGLERRIVDGHSPGLRGRALQAYVAAGISSDHECTTAEEAAEKLALGMRIYLREGSAARNLEALAPIVTAANAWRCCFATDDRHPGDLAAEGHVDHVVRVAVRLGVDAVTALAMASLHAAEHYRRPDLGAVAPGRFADLIVFERLDDVRPVETWFHGRPAARGGAILEDVMPARPRPDGAFLRGSVRLPEDFGADHLRVAAEGAREIRVIGMDPHQLVTGHLVMPATIRDGFLEADPARDVLKLAVIERHRGTGNVGVGFVHGFGIARGALASTVGHDSHNVTVVGADDDDMVLAARTLEACGGGQCVVAGGAVLALLPLPLGGLLSDQPVETVVRDQAALLDAARSIGSAPADPFMPLSFLPLTVIPHLKLSDRGLVDVDAFDFVDVRC